MPEASGGIKGTVKTIDNLPMPGVVLTATESSSASRTVVSDAEGRYTFAHLEPGPYSVQAEMPGFKPVEKEHIEVEMEYVTVDFEMSPVSQE